MKFYEVVDFVATRLLAILLPLALLSQMTEVTGLSPQEAGLQWSKTYKQFRHVSPASRCKEHIPIWSHKKKK